ncbi:hypothetical protein PH210_28855 [Paenibacillus sp. BSR1-1]|uniref:hypothetical protein n=1 Tax=Paenibacillus sp. BSR1-1 TaxID=3020845 RepID=UPI0025B0B944|nr:hypothetical protein [Paenibacillus sp. BSR1-1]MDN3020157.1 hypothetical protein [Paenibacillus sp. BSR1-1]
MVDIYKSNFPFEIPAALIQGLVSFEIATSKGEYAQATTVVQDLTGNVPISLKQFLSDNKQLLFSDEK